MESSRITEASLTIKISDFEGPLDVLLHLIKKAEMNIFDLPIAEITAQYVDFLQAQRALQLDVAGEYLVMAANLLRLKSHDLLPVEQAADEELFVDEIDPREALMLQLLTYKQFQVAAENLRERETAHQQSFTRLATVPAEQILPPLAPGLGLVDLQTAFAQILARHQRQKPLNRRVVNDAYTLQDALTNIRTHLANLTVDHAQTFTSFFADLQTREALVMNFLAILELAKTRVLLLEQGPDDILITKGDAT